MRHYQQYVRILCVILSTFAFGITLFMGKTYIFIPALISAIGLVAAIYNKVLESLSLTAFSLILIGFLSGKTIIIGLGGIIVSTYMLTYIPGGMSKTYYKPYIYTVLLWIYLTIIGIILYTKTLFSITYNLLLIIFFTALFSLVLYFMIKPPEPYSTVEDVARFLYKNRTLPVEFLVGYYTISAMLATHIALLAFLFGAITYAWGRLMGYDRMINLFLYTIVFIVFLFLFGKIGAIDLYISG